jgi:hypothetical protein
MVARPWVWMAAHLSLPTLSHTISILHSWSKSPTVFFLASRLVDTFLRGQDPSWPPWWAACLPGKLPARPTPIQSPSAYHTAPLQQLQGMKCDLDFILSYRTELTNTFQLKQNKTWRPFIPGIFLTLTSRLLPTILRYLLNWGPEFFFHPINYNI